MTSLTVIATLVGMVESSMFMFCGFRLAGFVPPIRALLLSGAIHAVLVRVSRHLFYTVYEIPFGSHIIVALVLFFMIGYFRFKLPAVLAAMAVVIGYMILLIGTLLVLLLLPDFEPVGFVTILSLILVEQLPLIASTVALWVSDFTIVPKRVAQKLGARQ